MLARPFALGVALMSRRLHLVGNRLESYACVCLEPDPVIARIDAEIEAQRARCRARVEAEKARRGRHLVRILERLRAAISTRGCAHDR